VQRKVQVSPLDLITGLIFFPKDVAMVFGFQVASLRSHFWHLKKRERPVRHTASGTPARSSLEADVRVFPSDWLSKAAQRNEPALI
jgi:hypothetical protein